MKVLGVSGSPIEDSNTDKALKMVLAATGMDCEFIKLVKYNVAPCTACLGCVKTNRCVIADDGILLAEKVKAADALVIAGFSPYSTLDSRTKAFIERLYPLRHIKGYMVGKPGGAVVTSAVPQENQTMPLAGQIAVNAVQYYMMEEGMNFLGSVIVQGNVPCIKCGFGDECKMSGVKMLFGAEATVDTIGINYVDMQPEAIGQARTLGKQIAQALTTGRTTD